MSVRIAELIKKANLLDKENFSRALEFSQRDNISICQFILRNSLVDEPKLMGVLSQGLGIPVWDLSDSDIESAVINCIPRDMALSYRIIPINRVANNLIVAMGDPTNLDVIDKLAAKLGHKLKVMLASESTIDKALQKYYVNKMEEMKGVESISDNYTISFLERLMAYAAQRKCSDIHIEPFEFFTRIRLRTDGSLIEYEQRVRPEMQKAIASRIKIISNLNITETRLPQDGNTKIEIPNVGKMDFRVSVLPTVWGEKIVMRLLDKSNLQLDMTKLGFETDQITKFSEAIHKPFGMVLVTGPTGSGKTTTLYSALNELNRITDNIMTAEDPVEFTIPGICQVNIRYDIGLTFASALKAFLRQDPDIIMLGEVRDKETAEIAMKAALTGHVVLSTLHTNTAPETIERLRNMGVESFTIVSALNAIVAQRLVRKICEQCKEEDTNILPEEMVALGLPKKYAGTFKVYKGNGCDNCNGTGYKGRAAIYEVLSMNDTLRRAVVDGESVLKIKQIAMKTGMQTLRQSAWKKVYKGVTSIEELLESSSSDTENMTKSNSENNSTGEG